MKSIVSQFRKVAAYLETPNGRARIGQVKRIAPMLVFVMLGILAAEPAHATTTSVGTAINSGFKSIYDIAKIAIGGVALAMGVWHGFKWFGGDQEAPKKLAMVGIIGIVMLNLDTILGLFGLTI